MAIIFDKYLKRVRLKDTTSGGSAHVVQGDGTPQTNRANLNFRGFEISDDLGTNATIVDLPIQLEDIRTGGGGGGGGLEGLVVRTTSGAVFRAIDGADSLSVVSGDGLAGNPTVVLEGDSASPGNDKFYGTDGSGAKGWQPMPGGSLVVTETEVDFGTTPTTGGTFTITDPLITSASKIMVTESGNIATDRIADGDSLWDTIDYSCLAADGSFTLYARASGSVVGCRKLYYTYA